MAEEARQGAGQGARQGAGLPSPPSPPTPEKCFYASFKIFLNPDSRTNSIIGSDSEDSMLSGTGEVVRIEKTMEVSDRESDDEKTLSNSNENILSKDNADTDDDIDLEVESYNRSVLENPVFVFTETASSSRTASPPATPRNSRALARTDSQRRRAASCTEPRHRRRASSCQRREKEVNLGGNLDTLTESEENLSSELERQAGRAGQQLISGSLDLLAGRVGELPPLPSGHRARSLTPGLANLPDRHRKTAIPVLCSRATLSPAPRPASACGTSHFWRGAGRAGPEELHCSKLALSSSSLQCGRFPVLPGCVWIITGGNNDAYIT